MELFASYSNPYVSQAMSISIGVIVAIIVVALAIDITIACITGSIARKKGRSYGGWWCLSFFLLGLIALIIILCLSDNSYNQNQYYRSNPPSYYNFYSKKSANPYQDYASRGKINETPEKPETKTVTPWTCPNCGQTNNGRSVECINCGVKKPY